MTDDLINIITASSSSAFINSSIISRDSLVGETLFGYLPYNKRKKSHKKANKKLKSFLKKHHFKLKTIGYIIVSGPILARSFIAFKTDRHDEFQVIAKSSIEVNVNICGNKKYKSVNDSIVGFDKRNIRTSNHTITL